MTERPYGFFRGEGGFVVKMDLPLPEVMADKVIRRQLVQVNEDGTPLDDGGPGRAPAKNAPKPEWVGWAVHNGMTVDEADALTKNDLIERFGPKE